MYPFDGFFIFEKILENQRDIYVFLRIEVAPEYRLPSIKSRIEPENFILTAMTYRIALSIGREITMENLQAADCVRRNTVWRNQI